MMPNPKRRDLLGRWLCLLLSVVSTVGCAAPRDELKFSRPPIILVNIDTLRADHLGVYGYSRATSPNIDAFSEQAIRFEWAFSQAPNTPPSQASILTSLYPSSHGRLRKKLKLPPGVVTLAESLRDAGYDTAAFVDGGLMALGFGVEQGFEIYDDAAGGLEKIGPKVRKWLQRRVLSTEGASNGDPAKPFLLMIHTYDVHSPYEINPWRYRSMFLDGLELPSREFRRNMSSKMHKVWKSSMTKTPRQLSPQELAYAKAKYDAGIRHVDDWFGELMGLLDELKLLEPAIVVVFSDHGDEFQEHGSLFHDRVYATVTRIPLIIRLPGGRSSGIFDQLVESIDLMPTLLDVAGVEPPQPIHGQSLMPMIEGRGRRAARAVSESPFWGRVAVATDRYRLIRSRKGDVELYDYRKDPLEQENLADRLTAVTKKLLKATRRWERQVEAHRFDAEEIESFNPEDVEQLKALGYLN